LFPNNLSINALLATPAAPPSTVDVILPAVLGALGLVGITEGLVPVEETGATAGLVTVEVTGVVGLVVVEVTGATGAIGVLVAVLIPAVLTAGDAGRITEDTAGFVVTVTGFFPGVVTTRDGAGRAT
jgi:hypothetical protein